MSGETSTRSDLIDVTYSQLHLILSGHQDGVRPDQVKAYLDPRKKQLGSVTQPFGRPSAGSKKIIESGSVNLPDMVVLRVEEADKEFVFAVSSKFEIDEIQALILLRSFLYNQGMPPISDPSSTSTMAAELVDAISAFFSSEYLHTFRVLIPLFRARENSDEPLYDVAYEILPQIIPDGPHYAQSIISEYLRRTQVKLPDKLQQDPKGATLWAKQNLREQLVLLEVLFWTMWGYVSCTGPLVEVIFETAYRTNLGALQANSNLLLDDESRQLQQDCAAIWILITVEILELEGANNIELSDSPERVDVYYSSPETLKRLHDIVTSHSDSQYSCTYLSWTYLLSRLCSRAAQMPAVPASYQSFFDYINPPIGRSYTKEREPIPTQMARACLDPEVGLFGLIESLLTNSPLFVTAVAWRTGSSVTDPNAIAYRSVLKGLIIALVELVPVEEIPDFDALVEVWIALFGRSESLSVTGICEQYWTQDWCQGITRRAILDVARSRFSIQVKPLLRLLRAMTGAGFLDTDPLYTSDAEGPPSEQRLLCARFVFHYFLKLSTYSYVIPTSTCTGAHALYERQTERFGSGSANPGFTYVNLKPIRLPGGSTLPAKSSGRLLSSDGGEHVVVCWQHEHSGWKFVLEILTDYVNRRRMDFGSGGDVSFARRGGTQQKTLRIQDIGMEADPEGDEAVITDALDLVRSLIQDHPAQASALMHALEDGEPVVSHTMSETQPPDLVQLTTMILEEALSRSNGRARGHSPVKLITSTMSVLSALLAIPSYSNRVWLYIRSTIALFGSDKSPGSASGALAAERATGQYTMTLALLQLVEQLFREAALSILPENAKLQQLKEEVLLRAARFVHTEIWVEHLSWKYAQLGDRFEIGKRVVSLYISVLESTPPSLVGDRPFAILSQTIADVLLFKATTSTITPLVSVISSGGHVLRMLYNSRRHGDVRRLIFLLQADLRLCRLILRCKLNSNMSTRPCLLEQALCARVTGGTPSHDTLHSRLDPIDVLASYIQDRDAGSLVPIEAARVLCVLSSSLSVSQPSPPTIIGHLSNPEKMVASLVRIIQHPYDELALRKTIWNFISLAVDKEPALATLFVTGKTRSPGEFKEEKGKEKAQETKKDGGKKEEESNSTTNALEAAREILVSWKELWEANPLLLACVLRFLDTAWQHALEHKIVFDHLRKDSEFWARIVSMACEEVGPVPTYETPHVVVLEGVRQSNSHEAVQMHAYRTFVKSLALHIITRDIGIHLQLHGSEVPLKKPESYIKLEPYLKSEDQLTDLLSEAAPSSYAPEMHDRINNLLSQNFPGLKLQQLELQEPASERDYGDGFAFSVPLLRMRLQAYPLADDAMDDPAEEIEKLLLSINLNLSLVHAETALLESWDTLLRQVIPYLRTDTTVRPHLLSIAASVSFDIAAERREGGMMAMIHGSRLSLVLALLEVAWFSPSDKKPEVDSFMELVRNLRNIVLNEAQPPAQALLSTLSVPFHRTLLQIIFYCTKHGRALLGRPKTLNAEQRLAITQTVEAILGFIINGLGVVFLAARTRVDVDVDRDMELLVAVFEQCTRPDIDVSSIYWLSKCQETDIIRTSFELYVHIDLVGLSDLPLLLSRKQPLYSPHLFVFHMALASSVAAVERFASDGLLPAYTNNFITSAASSGMIDIVLPELPNQRSPAHLAYCQMVSVVAMAISKLGRQVHYFDAETCGFVQLYGEQVNRALSWTIGDPITLPLLEEIDQVLNLFFAIATSVPASAQANPAVAKVLRGFTTRSLHLLQQVNYAITHPNHLASLYDPVTLDERIAFEKTQTQADPTKRPFVMHLIHRLFRISSNLVGTLITISRADLVLSLSIEDWPIAEALIVPHSKVVLGEPASLGTLLELGNRTLDVLRNLVQRPPGQSITDPSAISGSYTTAVGVKEGVLIARRNLEEIQLYAVTQLAMWISKPDFDTTSADAENDDPQAMDASRADGTSDRRQPRSSITMAERLRRGMTGEMAADLQSLLTKSKPILVASDTIIGGPSVDFTQILLNFLHERIGGST